MIKNFLTTAEVEKMEGTFCQPWWPLRPSAPQVVIFIWHRKYTELLTCGSKVLHSISGSVEGAIGPTSGDIHLAQEIPRTFDLWIKSSA